MMSGCADCEKPLCKTNKVGRCRRCYTIYQNADPAFQLRRSERIREKMADPAHRAKMSAIIQRNSAQWRATPKGKAWFEQHGRWLATEVLRRPENMAKAASPAARAKARDAKAAKFVSWCPEEYRETFYFLLRQKRLSACDARAFVQAHIAADKERAAAAINALSPFERQMRALERGGKIIANDAKPAGNQVVRRFG